MKHLSRRLMLVAGMAMVMLSLVACKKDKEDNATPATPQTQTLEVKFIGTATQDFGNVCGIFADYTIEYGDKQVKETGRRVNSSFTVSDITLPCTMTLKMKIRQIEDIDTAAEYSGTLRADMTVKNTVTGEYPFQATSGEFSVVGTTGAILLQRIDTLNAKMPEYKFRIDTDGVVHDLK